MLSKVSSLAAVSMLALAMTGDGAAAQAVCPTNAWGYCSVTCDASNDCSHQTLDVSAKTFVAVSCDYGYCTGMQFANYEPSTSMIWFTYVCSAQSNHSCAGQTLAPLLPGTGINVKCEDSHGCDGMAVNATNAKHASGNLWSAGSQSHSVVCGVDTQDCNFNWNLNCSRELLPWSSDCSNADIGIPEHVHSINLYCTDSHACDNMRIESQPTTDTGYGCSGSNVNVYATANNSFTNNEFVYPIEMGAGLGATVTMNCYANDSCVDNVWNMTAVSSFRLDVWQDTVNAIDGLTVYADNVQLLHGCDKHDGKFDRCVNVEFKVQQDDSTADFVAPKYDELTDQELKALVDELGDIVRDARRQLWSNRFNRWRSSPRRIL